MGIESVSVSLDGPEEVHDQYRQRGSYQHGLEAISRLEAKQIPVSVITTLHSGNARCLEPLYNVLQSHRLYAWQLQACNPMGNAAKSGIACRFDVRSVINFVEKYRNKSRFPIGIADNIGYFTKGEGSLRGNPSGAAVFRGCSAGLSSIGIDSAGNVRGCESMYAECFVEGNLRHSTLQAIWENPQSFSYNRQFNVQRLTGKCRDCEYAAKCKGGCRSYNYFSHGKLFESSTCVRGTEESSLLLDK